MERKVTYRHSLLLWAMLCLCLRLAANNISVGQPRIVAYHPSQSYSTLEFDLAWENSWRDSSNWDAAWVFVKFRPVGSSGAWSHATLHYVDGTNDGHQVAPGASIRTSNDGKGVFIYRSGPGSGNVNFPANRLRWDTGTDGIAANTAVEVKVLAIEMVYVPEGSFWIGDGENDPLQTYGNFEAGTGGGPYLVGSEAGIVLGGGGPGSLGNNNARGMFANGGCPGGCFNCSGDGCLGGSGDDFGDGVSQSLPAGYPKGYTAFYCMKYELTQQEFVDMVNLSTATQQNWLLSQSHFYLGNGNPSSNRWGFQSNSGTWSTVEPYVPMIYLDWMRGAAYADWSGLRPMTELEFEKACRGQVGAGFREFAWGNSAVDMSVNLVTGNAGQANEQLTAGYTTGGFLGNCWIRSGQQTMQTLARVGMFAAHPSNTDRVTAGASYYGIMELSGHAWERAVSVGHPEGRKYTGLHGDGNLDAAGYANVANWPGTFAGTLVNSNVGVGYRGGGLAYPAPDLERNARISSRRVASAYWDAVIQDDGTRFVHTAQ